MKKLSVVFGVLICALLLSCKNESSSESSESSDFSGFEKETYEVEVDKTAELKVTGGEGCNVSISNPKICELLSYEDCYARVLGKKSGATVITAKKEDKECKAVINVTSSETSRSIIKNNNGFNTTVTLNIYGNNICFEYFTEGKPSAYLCDGYIFIDEINKVYKETEFISMEISEE